MKDTKSARRMVSSPQIKHVNFEDKFYKCSWLICQMSHYA